MPPPAFPEYNDFNSSQGTSGIFYEEIGDSRATNIVNPAPPGTSLMPFQGTVAIVPFGPLPTYSDPSSFPYVQDDAADGVLIMHPGTGGAILGGGNANIGASIAFQAPVSGSYHIAGGFARDNPSTGAGDGVDVLVINGSDPNSSLFSTTISSANAVNTADPFSGTGTANFNLTVPLLAGQSVRFIVFSDSQGQDGTFDATAFRVNIAVPEPATLYLIAASADFDSLAQGEARRAVPRDSI